MKKINWKFWLRSGELKKRELYSPERDWFIALALATLMVIALFLIYFYLDSLIKALPDSRAPESTATSTTPRLTREDLQKYADDITTRQTQFKTLLQSLPRVTDPSI